MIRRLISFLCVFTLLIGDALALTPYPSPMMVRAATAAGPTPVVSQNFLSNTTPPTWLDYSGITGNRMMYDSTGKLTYAPNNGQLQSNTFSNAQWSPLGNSTVAQNATDPFANANTAWTWTATANGAATYLAPASTATGTNSIIAIYAKQGTARYIQISRSGAAGDYVNFDLLDGTFTNFGSAVGASSSVGGFWLVGARFPGTVPGATSLQIAMVDSKASGRLSTLTTAGTLIIYNASFSAVTYETTTRSGDQVITTSAAYFGPRFDYPNAVAAGLLVEESRTNLVTYSGDTTNIIWANTNAAKTTDGTLAPDGKSLFGKVTANAGSAIHDFYNGPITIVANSTYSASIYVKKGTQNYLNFAIQLGNNQYVAAVFDISGTGNISASQTSVGATSGTLISSGGQYLGNSVYRLNLVFSINGVNVYPLLNFAGASTGNTFTIGGEITYNAAGTETFYAWGLQVELGSFPTSYIPTTSASVTRAADIIKLSGTALTTIGGAAGTVLQEFTPLGNTAANQYGIYGNTVSPIYYDSALAIKATNGTNILSSGASATVGSAIRTGLAWDAGPSRAISVNGSAAVTDANSFGTIGATVYEGSNNGANTANGWIRAFSIYNSKLTGATFTTKTTTGGAL